MKTVLKNRVAQMTPEQIVEKMYVDGLTGVWNRCAFTELLEEKLSKNPRLIVAIVDLDSLKWINDNIGHRAGDEALKEVASLLEDRMPGRVFRLAGDEFLIYASTVEELHEKLGLYDDDERIYSYGIGLTLEDADDRLKTDKAYREVIGRRSERGEKPPWDCERFR